MALVVEAVEADVVAAEGAEGTVLLVLLVTSVVIVDRRRQLARRQLLVRGLMMRGLYLRQRAWTQWEHQIGAQ